LILDSLFYNLNKEIAIIRQRKWSHSTWSRPLHLKRELSGHKKIH